MAPRRTEGVTQMVNFKILQATSENSIGEPDQDGPRLAGRKKLHRDEGLAVLFVNVMDGADVGVV